MKDNRAMNNSKEFDRTADDDQAEMHSFPTTTEKHPNLTLLESGQNPGELLKSARERLGLSLGAVSLQTKINERQLQAIESGVAERLPPETFAKAFIKSYCKVVRLDSEPVLRAFGFEVHSDLNTSHSTSSDANKGEPKMPNSSRRLSTLSFDRKPVRKRLGYMVALIAIFAMAAFYVPVFFGDLGGELLSFTNSNTDNTPLQGSNTNNQPAPLSGQDNAVLTSQNDSGEVNASKELSANGVPNAVDSSMGTVSESIALPLEGPVPDNRNSIFPAIQAENQKNNKVSSDAQALVSGSNSDTAAVKQPNTGSATTGNVAGVAQTGAPITGGESTLKFGFSDPSWVTVRDATDRVLLSQLNESGSSIQVKGVPPFKVIVGNAKMVTLNYRGKNVDLMGNTKGEVARLTLE